MQIRLLREVLEWGEGMGASMQELKKQPKQVSLSQVVRKALRQSGKAPEMAEEQIIVLVFPEGDFKVVPKGTTAANIIQEKASTDSLCSSCTLLCGAEALHWCHFHCRSVSFAKQRSFL